MRLGKILRFDEIRGYGFIVPDGGGEDVFVHANELCDDKAAFTPGTPVEFEVTEGDRGFKAFAVRIVGRESVNTVSALEVKKQAQASSSIDDGLCDVLSPDEFMQELTEMLLEGVPELTGAQIVRLRRKLLTTAQKHGWVEE